MSRLDRSDQRIVADRRRAYVAEALEWLPDAGRSRPCRGRICPRVLLADDNADLREYARRLLAEHYDVHVVADGQAALEAARELRPDLIVSDVMMPRLDGFGLIRECARIRSCAPFRSFCSRRAPAKKRASKVSIAAPTTTWSSRSARASCWCASAR